MFCDIRGFTSLSEQMSPQQLMNFLNSYFLRMNAPIHDNGGFIDKFIGDAIMALFDHPHGTPADKACDAIKAALDLQKALRLYNHHRANSGYLPVKHGVGLHYGPVVLGTVGSDDRMDTTVIGDTVNVAQRIEGLTEQFNADILCTRSLIDAAQSKKEIAHRSIDTVVLKGKSSRQAARA
jgi:adenylate cyclase